ncbi:MAG: polymer-forming cytoskeletal protein [Deltaproteobacteria bacterium]|nr:polymer-forming cytoskeletal protein [Deltaproteobacteria bacterium]
MFSRSNKIESLVGEDAKFNGDLVIKGTIRVDGNVSGNIDVDWLILGEKAFLEGDVKACGVVVAGKIRGNIEAKEIVSIKSKGHVKGNIRTAKLSVDEGAVLDGMMIMSGTDHSEIGRKDDSLKVVELKNDKNRADKIKNIKLGEIKFEEVKSL